MVMINLMFSRLMFTLPVFVLVGCANSHYNLGDSFKKAVSDPMVWANAGVGVVLSTGDFDERVSHSAMKHTYVFGSQDNAMDASDDYRAATRISMNISSFVVSADDDAGYWGIAGNKALRFVTDNLNAAIVATTTADIKRTTDRDRPNGGCCGFPSGHASRAFATATIAKHNYRASELPGWVQNSAITATYFSAYLTGWARVEAGEHYPSQVFWGAAYGAFLSSMLHDVTQAYGVPFSTLISASPQEVTVSVFYAF